MSLQEKIRKLIEASMTMEAEQTADYNSASDEEVVAACEANGLEDMIVRDEEGNLANRDECVQALDTLEMSQQESTDLEEVATDSVTATLSGSVRVMRQAVTILKRNGVEIVDRKVFDDDDVTELKVRGSKAAIEKASDELEAKDEFGGTIFEAADDEELPVDGELEDAPAEDELDAEAPEDIDELPPEEGDEPEEAEKEAEDEEGEVTVVVVSPELQADEDEEETIAKAEDEIRKEHFAMLMDGQDLSEEFKTQAQAIFASAVKESVAVHKKSLQEKFNRLAKKVQTEAEKQIAEAKEQALEEMAEIVDGYMTEGVQSWVTENAIAVTQNVRAEIAEEFIDGLKTLFVEHYVEIPEEKFDLVKAQEDKIAKLTESVQKLTKERAQALAEAQELKYKAVLEEAVEGMTDLDKARFMKLAENLEFKSAQDLSKQLNLLRESFDRKTKTTTKRAAPMVESVRQAKPEVKTSQNDPIAKYVQALDQTLIH